jgi:long-subunit acyl-CoA synthetase (AMP-forming)/GNAT superfamily N-acetyltransferase
MIAPTGSRFTAATPDEVASRVAEMLESAAAVGAAGAEELDRQAMDALHAVPRMDRVLERVPVAAIAALVERCTARLAHVAEPERDGRAVVWDALDIARRSPVLRRIPASEVSAWSDRFLAAVEASHLTVGPLFRQRARTYGSKTLFEIPGGGRGRSMTWREAAGRVELYARGLRALDAPHPPGRIAMLAENAPEMALLDLACLTSGMVNVVIPANSTEQDVEYVLRHARIRTLIVSDRDQYLKVRRVRDRLPELERVLSILPVDDTSGAVEPLELLERRAAEVAAETAERAGEAVKIGDLATVMYTSGTTGMPKGIQYSHRNVVFKRFARALAIPEIGEDDVFLAYLPLYHTFGRYLEMLGCVFWGAKYCFLLDPSVEALVDGMARHRPTVFISVPKKWIQLYEAIGRQADVVHGADEEQLAATRAVTGGRLRWGVSAAGHLEPEVFRFFQRQGVELMSGFGMSEATGGITMTPPGRYKDESLGGALPGIELKLADDGELLVRGPYVMMGYLDPPDGEPSFDPDGWLHTGDLMQVDGDGFIRLVDRKKEIYKNVKGQTVAPQRIENLFREFESVGRAFLVGDHREYNTLLIYPNPQYQELDFATLGRDEVRAHFRSLVVSVNKFVAPFERIVDFAVIERDLDAGQGELTPKGTPRRKVVADHFADVIESLYRRTTLPVGGGEVTVPNWLFQALGITAQDLRARGDEIVLPSLGTALRVSWREDDTMRVGSCRYSSARRSFNLGTFLATPRLWLGNEELVGFAPLELASRERPGRVEEGIEWLAIETPLEVVPGERERLEEATRRSEWDLIDLDRAARCLATPDEAAQLAAVRFLERVLANEDSLLFDHARAVLPRAALVRSAEVRRRAFQVLVPAEKPARFRPTVERFAAHDPDVLDPETSALFCELGLAESKVETLIELAEAACLAPAADEARDRFAVAVLRCLAEYGAAHPIRYRRTRTFLVRMSRFARDGTLRSAAQAARETLERGFHAWLGPTVRIAVDTETGREYRWEDVVVFDEGVPEDHRRRLLGAIRKSALIREAIFLFFEGRVVRLHDIPPGGVWIRQVGSRHGKSVYRVTVQTRGHDAFDLAVNLVETLPPEDVREEMDWLVLCGESGDREPVVEEYGGYSEEYSVWSEEFIPGDTLNREMRRLARRTGQDEGLVQLWPFLAWSALSAYVEFWRRTGGRLEVAELSPSDIVLPTHDYHRGSRIVSLSARRPHEGLLAMLDRFHREFVRSVEAEHSELAGIVGWDVVFSSLLEIVGEREGLEAFERAIQSEPGGSAELRTALPEYVAAVRRRGFLPMRLFFAGKRYRRWLELNPDATPQARARTLQEFYDTYGLHRLARQYPEARLRYFRETVFRNASADLAKGLDEQIAALRARELKVESLAGAIAELRHRLQAEPDDDYFLARIPFAYLRPEDMADFVRSELGGTPQSEIVMTLEDADANPYRVRHALSPKEVERLHRLFLAARLDVRFRPEHRYLVALNPRDQIIGGIYYDLEEAGEQAHLEKIVVAERYRRKGVSDGLMREFFNRLRAAGVRRVTTGFFRPEYFYALGFAIEKRYAGLVKELGEVPGEAKPKG